MTILLNGPGMTVMHRVGLGGLFMTLKVFDRDGISIDGLEWTLGNDRVELDFTEPKPGPAFRRLIESSFQVDNVGFYRFPGLEERLEPSLEKRYLLYEALRGTFLQFGPHNETGPKRAQTYDVDEQTMVIEQFGPVTRYRHQEAAKDFLNAKDDLIGSVSVKGWLYPGAAEKHVGLANSGISEPPELALCLLYAPVGAIYYRLDSRVRQRKARTAVVLPHISDLGHYAQVRRRMGAVGTLELTASGPADAGLRYLVQSQLVSQINQDLVQAKSDCTSCLVICFGIVSWSEKQKTRTGSLQLVSTRSINIDDYRVAFSIFRNRWQPIKGSGKRESSSAFVKVMTTLEIIAENCAHGRPWFAGFADAMSKKELREQLQYEWKELSQMVQKSNLDDSDRIFVEACQEAWRRRMGQIGDRAKRENADFTALVDRERERIRVSLSRSKNAAILRETIADLWARAGNMEVLRDGWRQVLPLLSDSNWRKARDLAMIALVSYKPSDKEQAVNE